ATAYRRSVAARRSIEQELVARRDAATALKHKLGDLQRTASRGQDAAVHETRVAIAAAEKGIVEQESALKQIGYRHAEAQGALRVLLGAAARMQHGQRWVK